MAETANNTLRLTTSHLTKGYTLIQLLVCVVAITLAFGVIHGGRMADNLDHYQWEDLRFIRHNQTYIFSISDCFTKHPLHFGVYRPLTTNLYYYLGRKWFDNSIRVHHVINVGLYLINALLLYWLCRVLLTGWWALVPPVLWVSRLAHVEVVANTCEFQGLLATLFVLMSIGLFIEARVGHRTWPMIAALAAFGIALLSKETVVVLPGILIGFGLLYDRRSAWKLYLWPVGVVLVWGVLYLTVFKYICSDRPHGFLFDLSLSNIGTNLASYMFLFSNLLIYPLENLIMNARVASTAEHWISHLVTLTLTAAAGIYAFLSPRLPGACHSRARPAVFGLLFFACAAAPYLVLEGRLFMRYSYLPHAGLAITVTAVLRELVLAFQRMARPLRRVHDASAL